MLTTTNIVNSSSFRFDVLWSEHVLSSTVHSGLVCQQSNMYAILKELNTKTRVWGRTPCAGEKRSNNQKNQQSMRKEFKELDELFRYNFKLQCVVPNVRIDFLLWVCVCVFNLDTPHTLCDNTQTMRIEDKICSLYKLGCRSVSRRIWQIITIPAILCTEYILHLQRNKAVTCFFFGSVRFGWNVIWRRGVISKGWKILRHPYVYVFCAAAPQHRHMCIVYVIITFELYKFHYETQNVFT